jgi:hypothetical protein
MEATGRCRQHYTQVFLLENYQPSVTLVRRDQLACRDLPQGLLASATSA